MQKCSYCGRENNDAAYSCIECGTALVQPSTPMALPTAHRARTGMTSPKEWWQREKQRLVHEVRSKAHRRLNTVVLVSFLIMAAYLEVGKRALSIDVAKSVALLWKCLTLAVLFATIWYVNWRIYRRVLDVSLPALEPGWVALLAIFAFTFAVVSADVRVLFYIGTFLCLAFWSISERFYRRKCDRLKEHEERV